MLCWVYVWQDETPGPYYCGQTASLERRLREHNEPTHRRTLTTKRFEGPRPLIWSRECAFQSHTDNVSGRFEPTRQCDAELCSFSPIYFPRKSTRPRRTRLTPKAARSRFATLAITSEPAGPNTRPTLSAWNRTRKASAMFAPKARIVTG